MVVETRDMLLALGADFSEEEARIIFPGCRPLAWHYGHCVLHQHILLSRQGFSSTLSGDYHRLFQDDAVPSESLLFYPDPGTLKKDMERVYVAFLQFLATYFHPGRINPEGQDRQFLQASLRSILRMVSHEWYHAGQIAILRELLKKPPVET